MEQSDLFGGRTAEKRVGTTLRFAFVNGATLDLDSRTGERRIESPVTGDELRAALAIQKDYLDGWKGFSYVIRSAMHKEIRRGDVIRAVKWARLFARANGDAKVREYLRKIVFEETRNLRLHAMFKTERGLDIDWMTAQLAASKKKWEMDCREGAFARYVHAYERSVFTPAMSAKEVEDALDSQNIDTMYGCWWRALISGSQKAQVDLDSAIRLRLAAHADPIFRAFESHWFDHFYTTKTGLELLADMWSTVEVPATVVNLPEVPREEGVLDIPELFPYVYDNHTRPGLARYVKTLKNIRPGVALPEGVDLRWSGMVRGIAWREHAARQYGLDYKEIPWEKVVIPDAVWSAVNFTDAYFYAPLYRRAGIQGVPFPRG